MSKFYITTPLYYVNDEPHIGHAYTTILADVISRTRKIQNDDVYFLTGTDEHGQKVQEAAEKRNVSPKDHVDEYVKRFKNTWEKLNIDYDYFIRTTDENHKKNVKDILLDLYKKGDILEFLVNDEAAPDDFKAFCQTKKFNLLSIKRQENIKIKIKI